MAFACAGPVSSVTDNSNSVAHLVENEIPLSNLTPIQQTDNDEDDDIIRDDDCVDLERNVSDMLATNADDDDDDDIDDNNQTLGNLNSSSFNNKMSGSYNNLFTDKLNEESDFDGKEAARSSNSHPENVYSNIQSMVNGRRLSDCDASVQSDPNFHVYSNISASNSVLNETGASSSTTFLHDDLDLDDPVTAADANKSFAKSTNKSHKQLTASSGKRKKSTGDANKSISPQLHAETVVEIVQPSGYGAATSSAVAPAASTTTAVAIASGVNSSSSSSNSNTNFISPSRMRLLHDTTMIDTALDLDSLDGSSIGNNSQVCLVKTAIV